MSEHGVNVWDESKRYHGEWWPGHDKQTKFQGFLEFEDRRPRLTVVSPAIGQSVFNLAHPTSVHGELDSGAKVTLWDMGGNALEFLGTDAQYMRNARRFTYAILGEHLEDQEEQKFRFSAYRLRGLGTWSAMDNPIPRGLDEGVLPQYAPAELVSFDRDDSGVEYSATVRVENPRRLESDDGFSTASIINYTGEDARVVFECTPPAPARVHDLLLFDFQALLTFSYQGGAPLESERLAIDDLHHELDVMRAESFTGRGPTGHVFKQAMILTLDSAEPAVLFPAWWRAVEELYPAPQVISLYHHGTRGILESSVTSVIAVAEHLHSLIGPTTVKFPEGFLEGKRKPLETAMKQAFPGKANAAFREHMYQALGNNRPTLAIRLEELLQAVTPERLALMEINKEQWVSDVKRVRNLLAHTSSHVTRRGSDSSKLLDRVNAQTRAIVALLILLKMGLQEEALDRAATALKSELRRFATDED